MKTENEDRDIQVASTIRDALARVAQIPNRRPLPDTSTRDGVLVALNRYIEHVTDDIHRGVHHEQWAEIAKTATYLVQLQYAHDYVADVGLPNAWHRSADGAESDYQVVRGVIESLEDAIVTDEGGTGYSADLSTRDGVLEVLTQSLETTQGYLDKEIDYYTERIANLRTAIAWVVANGMPPVGTTK